MTAGTNWRELGLCTQVDPDLFFAEDEAGIAEAKAICRRCDVLSPCTTDALDNATGYGVQADMTAEERLAHPEHRRVLRLSVYLPETAEAAAEKWEAEQRRLARRSRAEADRRLRDHLDDLTHPLDRKAGR